MRRLLSGLQQGGAGAMPADGPAVDTAETVHISSLALLKMLKHGTLIIRNILAYWLCKSEFLK